MAMDSAVGDPEQNGPTLTGVWERLAEVMSRHYRAGRRHLLTEDVLRFATVALLEDHGVAPQDLAIEVALPGSLRGKLDLSIGRDTAIEFKFPRDPKSEVSAADTMTFGEMLADIYRLATLPYRHRLAVWLVHDRLAAYLGRAAYRHAITWPTGPGTMLELPPGLRGRLPATASVLLPALDDTWVRARVTVHAPAGPGTHLTVLRVTEPQPVPWPTTPVPHSAPSPVIPAPRPARQPGGVRAEILDAIDAIVVRAGSELFTPQEVLDEMKRRGTRYAHSTVLTMITSHMCVDGVSPTEWPDLRRVDRGLYRRLRADETP